MAEILHIDKDEKLISYHAYILEAAGLHVHPASSAQAARAYLETARPDVIITEASLAGKTDGFDLVKEINAKYPGIPVMILTSVYDEMDDAWKDAFDRDKSWLPVYRFMEKPVSPIVLAEEVEHVLEEAGHKHA
ncbi:MAG: response regulator [Elusimicrobiaceae bacterium]|jgi:two-component system nitrogen regulation response regulator GlnG